MEAPHETFDAASILKYLGLPSEGYEPDPKTTPLAFLSLHLSQLPPQILSSFSKVVTPRQRASVKAIRNRRLTYALSNPAELGFTEGRRNEPFLWEGRPGEPRRELEDGDEEREWANTQFMGGSKVSVGKIGELLAGYEEEREAERMRILRRERGAALAFPSAHDEEEEEEEDDEDEDEDDITVPADEPLETEEKTRVSFERLLRERFIDGLLEWADYDSVDYSEKWDPKLSEDEERWFDAEEES